MMKRLLYILCLAAVALTACKDDADPELGFAIDSSELTMAAEGGVLTLNVVSDMEWFATVEEPWLSVSPANGNGSAQCQVRIDSTMSHDLRMATVRFVRAGQTDDYVVTVRQLGFGRMVKADSADYHVGARAPLDERVLKAKVTTNVDFTVEVQYDGESTEWLAVQDYSVNFDRGSRPRTVTLNINWKMNDVPHDRVATVRLVPKSGTDATVSEFRVVQTAAPVIEDSRAGDSIALLIAYEKLQSMVDLDPSENMHNWNFITLWEKTDTALPCPEAIGRVRGVYFYMCDIKESIPAELGNLKYLRSLQIFSNVNSGFRSIELDTAICDLQYLKYLEIGAYGLVSLPHQFVRLGRTLEQLDLTANNFESIPDVLCQENFPHLNYLCIGANRRWTTIDLRGHETYASQYGYDEGIGLYFDTRTNAGRQQINRLFLWQGLETMRISYDFVEGIVPDYQVGDTETYTYTDVNGDTQTATHTIRAWRREDVKQWGDTIDYIIGKPYVMPKCRLCGINLNFFTGSLPGWILYHPLLMEWVPEVLTFNQQENGINTDGKHVGFDNVPANFEYYYEAYPLWRSKYELQEERTEEAAAARRGLSVEEFTTGKGPNTFSRNRNR